jgi:hypothetical protein
MVAAEVNIAVLVIAAFSMLAIGVASFVSRGAVAAVFARLTVPYQHSL